MCNQSAARSVPNSLLALVLATVDAKVLVGLCELVHAPFCVVDVCQNVLVHVPPILYSPGSVSLTLAHAPLRYNKSQARRTRFT